jgi:hypothetical protein
MSKTTSAGLLRPLWLGLVLAFAACEGSGVRGSGPAEGAPAPDASFGQPGNGDDDGEDNPTPVVEVEPADCSAGCDYALDAVAITLPPSAAGDESGAELVHGIATTGTAVATDGELELRVGPLATLLGAQ